MTIIQLLLFLLQLFSLHCSLMLGKIPDNCQAVTYLNLCIRCRQGYQLVPSSNSCVPSSISTPPSTIQSSQVILLPLKLSTDQSGFYFAKSDNLETATLANSNRGINKIATKAITKPLASGFSVRSSEDLNCKQKSATKCLKCYQGYFYNPTTKICEAIDSLCRTANSFGECESCFDGYDLKNGQCTKIDYSIDQISSKDPNCFEYLNGTCQQCAFRFYFNNQGKCVTVHPNCKTWDSSNGDCLSCFQGFYIQNEKCVVKEVSNKKAFKIVKRIDHCTEYNSSSTCSKCSYRYFLTNNICYQVNDLCETWDESNGFCQSCYGGYSIIKGRCEVEDPFCTIKTEEGCVQCAYRYFLNHDSKCQLVSSFCKDYEPLSGVCTSCFQGYKLQEQSGLCTSN